MTTQKEANPAQSLFKRLGFRETMIEMTLELSDERRT